MNLEGVEIKPTEGRVALRFVDEDDDDEKSETASYDLPSDPVPYEGCLAVIAGVGPKVKGLKVGQVVVTSEWARNGTKLADNLYLCETWDILATLKT